MQEDAPKKIKNKNTPDFENFCNKVLNFFIHLCAFKMRMVTVAFAQLNRPFWVDLPVQRCKNNSIKQQNKIVYLFFLVDIYKDFYKEVENIA